VAGLYTNAANELVTAIVSGTGATSLVAAADVRMVWVDENHPINLSEVTLDEVTSGDRVGSAVALSGLAVSAGVVTCTAPITHSTVSGNPIWSASLYHHTGTETTSYLIAASDSFSPRPITPVGTDIDATPLTTGAKLFRLQSSQTSFALYGLTIDEALKALFLGTSSSSLSATADLRVILCDSGYSPALATDEFLSDIAAGLRVGSAVALSGEAVSAAVFDADDPSAFGSLSGDDVYSLVYYDHTGTEATSRLIGVSQAFYGRPFSPTGVDAQLSLSNLQNKVFRVVSAAS